MMRLLSKFGRTATGIQRTKPRWRRPRRRSAPLFFESLEARNLLTAGFLDPTFGTNGKVVTDFFGGNVEASDVAIQSDGKIVVAGTVSGGVFGGGNFAVARYNADGTLDASFSGDGKVTTDIGQSILLSDDQAQAVAIHDGKIVVAGTTNYGGGGKNFALVRYDSDGSLDASFGNGGIVYEDFAGSDNEAQDLAIQADGKIVVVGASDPIGFSPPGILARFDSDGRVDTTFGFIGSVSLSFMSTDSSNRVAIQPDGKIVVGGTFSTGGKSAFSVVRHNPDGSLDGDLDPFPVINATIQNSRLTAGGMVLQPDGKIIMVGMVCCTTPGPSPLVRLRPDGTVDMITYEADLPLRGQIDDVAVQRDGKIILASSPVSLERFSLGLARVLADGSADHTFSFDGLARTELSVGNSVAIQPDGKTLLVGRDFVLARYLGDIERTKFFVADRAADNTFQYDAQGDLVSAHDLAPANTRPMGAAASREGSHIWQVDQNESVFVYRDDGTVVGEWTANGLSNPQGIATDATKPSHRFGVVRGDIWIVDNDLDKVFRYDAAAPALSGELDPDFEFDLMHGNSNPKGITTDGSTIWVVNDGQFLDKVYAYDTAGQLLHSWVIDPVNSKPSGITIDPANVDHLWIVDSDAKQIFQYNHASGLQLGWQDAHRLLALHPGNVNPQGIADPSPWVPPVTTLPSDSTESSRDVNRNGMITPIDALLVVNHLNEFGSQEIGEAADEILRRLDVNGDLVIATRDALLVINELNSSATAEAELPAATAHTQSAAFVSGSAATFAPAFRSDSPRNPVAVFSGHARPQPPAPLARVGANAAPRKQWSSENLPLYPADDEMHAPGHSDDLLESLPDELLLGVSSAWAAGLDHDGA